MHTKNIQLSAIMLFLIGINTISAQNKSLTVNISEVKNNDGKIHLAIFRPEDNFPYDGNAYKVFKTPAKKGLTTYTIKNLPVGEYAVAIFHDEDLSGVCETNFIGFPKEGYGFSRNFKVFLSAPPFSKSKILVDMDKTIEIMIRY